MTAEVYRFRKLGEAKFYVNIYHVRQYMVMCYHGNSQSQSSAWEAKYSWHGSCGWFVIKYFSSCLRYSVAVVTSSRVPCVTTSHS